MKSIPTFIINGFLESGKSSYIMDTIYNDGFSEMGKSLILCLEFGEEEYDLDKLNQYKCMVREINTKEEFNPENIEKIIKETKPNRIIVEMNGMWEMADLRFPKMCNVCQQITLFDSTTFEMYFNNMRQKINDFVKMSEVIIFNRAVDEPKLANYKRWLMMANPDAIYAFMRPNGEMINSLADDLPYNLNDDPITVLNPDYAIWYMDTFDSLDRYLDKRVGFAATIYVDSELPPNTFIPGRPVMNCCAEDIQFYGHLAYNTLNLDLKPHDWYYIVAKVTVSNPDSKGNQEIILIPEKMEKIDEIDEPVCK